MNPPKRQVFVDSFSFEEPNRRGTHKKSTTPRRATTKKPEANRKKAMPQPAAQPRKPKARVEPTPAEVEARQERQREYERRRAQTPERKELKRRITQERRDKAKASRHLCRMLGSPHPGRDPLQELRLAPPGVPKASQAKSFPAEGTSLRTNPHLLTTTPGTGRGPRPGPGQGHTRTFDTSKDSSSNLPVPVGDEAVIAVGGEEGQLKTGRRLHPPDDEPHRRGTGLILERGAEPVSEVLSQT